MDVDRKLNPKKETNGAPPKSASKKKRKHPYIIGAAIITVFTVHFAWQVSFIQKGNLRVTEDILNSARLDVAPVEVQPDEKAVEDKPELAANKLEVEETAKNVVPVKYVPPENKRPPVEMKKNAAREPTAERLRRAEKLLTGF